MNNISYKKLIAIFAIFFSFTAANAEPYIGINLGTGSIDNYEDGNSGFIYGGYDNKHWAIEAGVNPLGYYEVPGIDSSIQIDGFEIDLLGKLKIAERFTAYGSVGYFEYTLKPEVFGVPLSELDGSTITYGVGIMMDIGQTLKVRAAYEVYDDIEDLDASRIVFGVAAKVF